jgi:EmrB/QacA subfamily drug resistance transporter
MSIQAGDAQETDGASTSSHPNAPSTPPPNIRTVFAGLMLGMFLAAVNATIIAPAMPRIVAELGGMDHYSWIAVSALLASTVIVPVAGKLSDLFGRKAFYVGGIVLFMASSLVAGVAQGFGMFIFARILEGFGMGIMMPLSQAIIADLIPARDRGKYQGLMGGVFGLASVIGPFVGGFVTDTLSWRWLFFLNIPLGFVALGFIVPFMKLPHVRRPHTIDYAGFVTLSTGLTAVLLATVWGGTEYPWDSPLIIGLYAGGTALLALFLWVESRAVEPVLPLRLWKNSIFTTANIANMAVAMGMFGAIYFIPVFVQGVLGASVTGSGAVLTPMMLSIVAMSTISGLIVSRTGRYKLVVLSGIVLMGIGYYMLTQMHRDTSYAAVVRDMIFIGLGLGAAMQTFVLVVQNAVGREDLGVATATTQLFRSIGSSIGIAIMGTIMTQQMKLELGNFLPPQALESLASIGEAGAGAVLNPEIMATLSPDVLEGFRGALAAALHPVFVAALPFVGLAFLAALFMREVPLSRTIEPTAAEAGRELLAELNQAGADDAEPVLGAKT